ncbi:hypothetical protein [Streptomyces sp. NPDC059479]|uniref:hypothetical protein n=1 Tax=Streptomyces sp. NPDC059479 TaxID=3346848 RepID=UPI003689E128
MDNLTRWTSGTPALDLLVPHPTGLPPLCDREEFSVLLKELVADTAPRLFAVAQEYGDRVDGRVAAWGMAFEDHAEVISIDGHRRHCVPSPERALRAYRFGTRIVPHLVWL